MRHTQYGYYDGAKAVSLGDLDRFLDWLVTEDATDATVTLRQAQAYVAFAFRGVRLRAQSLATMPFAVRRKGAEDVLDHSEDWQNALGFWPDPTTTLWQLEESLTALGRAYLFKEANRVVVKNLKYLMPESVEPARDRATGEITHFERHVGNRVIRLELDEVVHFWHPDYVVEQGPPTRSPLLAALSASGVLRNADRFAEQFFGRGAIKATIFATSKMPNAEEAGRLKAWFDRMFRGIRGAFETGVFNADDVKAIPIGEGLESLSNNEMTRERREDIAVALGIPYSLLLSPSLQGLGSGGVADRDDLHFYSKTVKPEADFIARELNDQLLHPLGYHFDWLYDSLDVFTEDEKKRSASWRQYVDGGMRPEVAAWMLGMEIPMDGDIPAHYKDAFFEPATQGQLAGGMGGTTSVPMADDDDDEDDQQDKAADLARWQRFAVKRFDEGHPEKALAFESGAIEPTLKAAIIGALEGCETSDEVRRVFAWVEYP